MQKFPVFFFCFYADAVAGSIQTRIIRAAADKDPLF